MAVRESFITDRKERRTASNNSQRIRNMAVLLSRSGLEGNAYTLEFKDRQKHGEAQRSHRVLSRLSTRRSCGMIPTRFLRTRGVAFPIFDNADHSHPIVSPALRIGTANRYHSRLAMDLRRAFSALPWRCYYLGLIPVNVHSSLQLVGYLCGRHTPRPSCRKRLLISEKVLP